MNSIKIRYLFLILVVLVLCITFFNFYNKRLPYTYRKNSQITIVLKDFVDDKWTTEFDNYLSEKNYTWYNKGRSPKIARCYAVCNYSGYDGFAIFENHCNTSPAIIYDSKSVVGIEKYAEKTLPCFLKLTKSKIPHANLGVFTIAYATIPKGFVFGPYEINELFYMDGVDETRSNWMRYVNSARYFEEQNILPLKFASNVYYMTIKDIEPSTELLTWYGYSYATYLNISVVQGSNYDKNSLYAPPWNETICSVCPNKL